MFAHQTNSLAPGAGGVLVPRRILRWQKILGRLRPLRLGMMVHQLSRWDRLGRGLQLVERYFPAALPAFDVREYDWEDVLREFLHLVEAAGWLPIDWQLLDDLYNWWWTGDDDGDGELLESEAAWYMAEYLTGIPLRTLGWTDEMLLNEEPTHWRVILSGIVSETAMAADVIIQLEIYDALQDMMLEEIWERLETTDFSGYAEPLCWLPDIVRICAGCTGNEILDSGYDFDDLVPTRWTWADDLDRLRELWAEAKPLAERYEKFDEWMIGKTGQYDDAYRSRLEQMVMAALGVEWFNA